MMIISMMQLLKLLEIVLLFVGCTSKHNAIKQWDHSNLSGYAAAFSKYALVGDTDAPARLWDLKNNKDVSTTTLVGFSTDSKVAANA